MSGALLICGVGTLKTFLVVYTLNTDSSRVQWDLLCVHIIIINTFDQHRNWILHFGS